MKHINYKTRFKFHIAQSIGGSEVNWQDDWRAVFSTSGTNKGYEASYISGAETNCEVKGDGTVTIFMNNYNLEPGVLTAVVYTRNANGAWQNTATVNTGVELVGGSTDAPTDQDLQVLLPYVYIDAYTIAKENGYTGTQADYVKLLGSLGNSFLSLKGGVVDGDVEVKNFKALEITTDIVNTGEVRTSRIALTTGQESLTFDAIQVTAFNNFSAQNVTAGEIEVTNGTVGCMIASPFAVQVYGALITRGLQAEGGSVSGDFSFGSNVEVSGELTASGGISVLGIYSPHGTIDQLTAGELTTGTILGHNGQLALSADNIILEGVNELNVGKVSASEGVIGMLTSNGYTTQVRGLLSANAISADSAEIGELNVGKISGITTLQGYGITDALPYLGIVDANSVKTSGYGYVTSNGVGGNGGLISFGGASYQTQLYADYLGNNLYWRVNNNNTHSSWAKIATKGTTLEHYGITNAIPYKELNVAPYASAVGYGYPAAGFKTRGGFISAVHHGGQYGFALQGENGNSGLYYRGMVAGKWNETWRTIAFVDSKVDNAKNADSLGTYDSAQYMRGVVDETADVNTNLFSWNRPYIWRTTSNPNTPFSHAHILHVTSVGSDGAFELCGAMNEDKLLFRRGSMSTNSTNIIYKNEWREVLLSDNDITVKSLMIPSVVEADASGVNILCDSQHQGNVMLTYHADSLKGLHTSLMGEHARDGARYHLIGLQDNPDKCILSIGSKSYNPSGAVEEIVLQTVDNAGGIVLHGKVYVPERFKLGGATFTWDATNERVVCDKPIVTA